MWTKSYQLTISKLSPLHYQLFYFFFKPSIFLEVRINVTNHYACMNKDNIIAKKLSSLFKQDKQFF